MWNREHALFQKISIIDDKLKGIDLTSSDTIKHLLQQGVYSDLLAPPHNSPFLLQHPCHSVISIRQMFQYLNHLLHNPLQLTHLAHIIHIINQFLKHPHTQHSGFSNLPILTILEGKNANIRLMLYILKEFQPIKQRVI